MRCVILLLCLSAPAIAADHASLYGLWGDAKQCARAPIQAYGTKLAEPFEIRPGWLRHGDLWCRLSWFPSQPRAEGIFAAAQALCGEDSARAYRLGLHLRGEALTLIWDDALANGPLHRC